MRRAHKILSFVIAFLLILPTISLAAQFMVTRVYDGDTVEGVALEVEGGP